MAPTYAVPGLLLRTVVFEIWNDRIRNVSNVEKKLRVIYNFCKFSLVSKQKSIPVILIKR